MKNTIFASIAAAGGLILLTITLLKPAALTTAAGETAANALPEPVSVAAAPEPQAVKEPEAETPARRYDETQTISVLCGGEIQELRLDDYLTGVVLAEMPPSFESEALAAQAAAARTLALKRLSSPKHEGAALCTQSACCQAYLTEEAAKEKYGEDWARWEAKARKAVEETDGLVIRCQGGLIDAVYFSSAGGATEPAAAVWGGEVPYLQSVESPDDGERFTEERRIGVEEFRTVILRETPEARLDGGAAGWFGAAHRSEGGGVMRLRIGGVDYNGVTLRKLFSLRSTNFTVAVEGGEIVFLTHGSGHRVGMSQYGAQAMALAGADFREILNHYYQGIEIGRA